MVNKYNTGVNHITSPFVRIGKYHHTSATPEIGRHLILRCKPQWNVLISTLTGWRRFQAHRLSIRWPVMCPGLGSGARSTPIRILYLRNNGLKCQKLTSYLLGADNWNFLIVCKNYFPIQLYRSPFIRFLQCIYNINIKITLQGRTWGHRLRRRRSSSTIPGHLKAHPFPV